MKNKKQNYDRAFELLLQAIEETNEDERRIGEYTKEISKLEEKKKKDTKKANVMAAHYFSEEKISELHKKTVELLKDDDFNEQEYIEEFSDISKIETEHVNFLIERQRELESFEKDFSNELEEPPSNNKMVKIANILLKGGANND